MRKLSIKQQHASWKESKQHALARRLMFLDKFGSDIDAAEVIEIAEALHWLRDWFASDPGLAASLHRFTHGLTTLDEINSDLDRFATTLIGDRP